MHVLLRSDSTTVVAYINNLGGTVSSNLVHLAGDLWMWCLKKNIHLTAQHLPGVEYVIADAESQSMRHRSDWQLDPAIFRQIAHWFGPIDVDLFATSLATQCPVSAGGQILVQQQRMHSYRTGLISRVMQTLLGT